MENNECSAKAIRPLFQEIPYGDPLAVFENFHHEAWALFLDSAISDPNYGRFTYIAVQPFQTLWLKDGQILFNDKPIQTKQKPFDLLKQLLAPMQQIHLPELPPFQTGIAGSFSYDLYQYLENIPPHAEDEMQFPDMSLGFYDVVIAFDVYLKKSWIISSGWPENEPGARERRASQRLEAFKARLRKARESAPLACKRSFAVLGMKHEGLKKISSNFDKISYMKAVETVKAHILAGDIFQANISQCFKAQLPDKWTPFDLYCQLRASNPAPFAAFFNLSPFFVVSASPERFLSVIGNQVETRPIKGTIARSEEPLRDKRQAEKLLNSEKDRAENIMIVDLLRNDLSKVCKEHSITVTKLCGLETYKTVHHLVSVIEGELKNDKDALDLLMAAFPGGSVTGAPKIRAMQVIASIEPCKRGLYCGNLGFVSFSGAMDTSVVIRSYLIKNKSVRFQAGGAIVLDSSPDSEYQESFCKSAALYDLLNPAHDFVD